MSGFQANLDAVDGRGEVPDFELASYRYNQERILCERKVGAVSQWAWMLSLLPPQSLKDFTGLGQQDIFSFDFC